MGLFIKPPFYLVRPDLGRVYVYLGYHRVRSRPDGSADIYVPAELLRKPQGCVGGRVRVEAYVGMSECVTRGFPEAIHYHGEFLRFTAKPIRVGSSYRIHVPRRFNEIMRFGDCIVLDVWIILPIGDEREEG